MARYEHLPIYKKAMDLAIHLEKIVRNFSRYHKYKAWRRAEAGEPAGGGGNHYRQFGRSESAAAYPARDHLAVDRASAPRLRRGEPLFAQLGLNRRSPCKCRVGVGGTR